MESEEDSKLPFLDCLLQSESDGMLTSTVYTDKNLHTQIYTLRKRRKYFKVMVMTTQPLGQALKSYLLEITQILSKRKV